MPESLYFKGFHGIRFIAASAVIVHHLEEYISIFLLGREDLWTRPFFYQLGRQGVALFFVLSGFLITYLLLVERQKAGRIALGKFYMRRILRIWPLYFLILLTGYFLWPRLSFLQSPALLGAIPSTLTGHNLGQFALYGTLFPNVAIALYGPLPMVSHLWSIGVEEQFYLLWPWLFIQTVPARTWRWVGAVVLALLAWFLYERFVIRPVFLERQTDDAFSFLAQFLAQFRITCMAIGGLGAWLLFNQHPILPVLYRRGLQWGVYAVLLLLISLRVKITGINYESYALFFGFAILNLAGNPHSVLRLENGFTRFMGAISYGLYMYHPLVLTALLNLMPIVWPGPVVVGSEVVGEFRAVLYVGAFGLTVLVAWLSYQYIEQPFLRLKHRYFTVVERRRRSSASRA